MRNPFAHYNLGSLPDDGSEPRNFTVETAYYHGRECIQLRLRQHRDGRFSVGYFIAFADPGRPAANSFPTPAAGVFASERNARLFLLGHILSTNYPLTADARNALETRILELRAAKLF